MRGDGSYLADLWRVLTSRTARSAALFGLVAAVITGAVSFFIPRTYKSEAKILPTFSESGGSSLLKLASSAGLGDLLSGDFSGAENPVLTYPEILLSHDVLVRTLASPYPTGADSAGPKVLDALGVRGEDTRKRMDDGVRAMGDVVDVRANPRSGLITVSAVSRDSVLSAYIVNRLLAELNRFNLESRASQGKALREFVEGQLVEARREMTSAEQALASFRASNMRIGNSPQLQVEQGRLEREVEVRSQLYDMLARQYEMARIDEKRDTPTFSIIDQARPPVRKHSPKILLNALVAAIAGAGLWYLYAYLRRPAPTLASRRDDVAAVR